MFSESVLRQDSLPQTLSKYTRETYTIENVMCGMQHIHAAPRSNDTRRFICSSRVEAIFFKYKTGDLYLINTTVLMSVKHCSPKSVFTFYVKYNRKDSGFTRGIAPHRFWCVCKCFVKAIHAICMLTAGFMEGKYKIRLSFVRKGKGKEQVLFDNNQCCKRLFDERFWGRKFVLCIRTGSARYNMKGDVSLLFCRKDIRFGLMAKANILLF